MKRTSTFILMALLPVLNSLSGQNISLPNKSGTAISGSYPRTIEWFDWYDDEWTPNKTVTMTYTDGGLPLTELWDFPYSNDRRILISYNAAHLPVLITLQDYIANTWTDIVRGIMNYDGYGNITETKQEHFNAGSWLLDFWLKSDIVIVNGKIQRSTLSSYDDGSAGFKLLSRTTSDYDTNGWLSQQTEESYNGGVWLNTQRSFYHWKTEAKKDFVITESFVESAWLKQYKYVYTHGENDSYSYLVYLFDNQSNDFITPYRRFTQTYDSHQNLILSSQETMTNDTWLINYADQYEIVYEGDHARERISRMWLRSPGSWYNLNKEVFSNYINLGIGEPENLAAGLDCYPNPSSGLLSMDYSLFGGATRSVELIDMKGNVLMTGHPEFPAGHLTWDISSIPSGLYLVRMTAPTGRILERKIIKQ